MSDDEIIAMLRAEAKRLDPVALAKLLEKLLDRDLSLWHLVSFFFRAFPSIPLTVLRRTSAWGGVTNGAGKLSDEGFNAHLAPWIDADIRKNE
jgi:hypothetical protein